MADGDELLSAGARVNRVDEEGNVHLFLYSLHTTIGFNVGTKGVPFWARRIGGFVTIRVTDGQAPVGSVIAVEERPSAHDRGES